MNSLLNAKFGHKNVKSSVENADYFGLTDNGPVALSEVGYQDTQEKMGRLLLGEYGGIPFTEKGIKGLVEIK
jgi:hypothetical protein